MLNGKKQIKTLLMKWHVVRMSKCYKSGRGHGKLILVMAEGIVKCGAMVGTLERRFRAEGLFVLFRSIDFMSAVLIDS